MFTTQVAKRGVLYEPRVEIFHFTMLLALPAAPLPPRRQTYIMATLLYGGCLIL